jgi:membrane protein DedA with SNARE-associated domain
MIEPIIAFLEHLPAVGILAMAFGFAFIENLFPPSPSDVVLVVLGTLVGTDVVGFAPTLVAATSGSVLGFAAAYSLGARYGTALAESPLVPFITQALITRVEAWFAKYHGLIVLGNRFLAGTRAVVSFVAGITRQPFLRTVVLSAISATVWNALLIYAGSAVGENWRSIDSWLSLYGWVVTGLLVLAAIIWYIRKQQRRSQD